MHALALPLPLSLSLSFGHSLTTRFERICLAFGLCVLPAFFFIDFLKGTQNANNNNNSTDEQRQQQQQDEHYGHIIGHYYSVSFYY